MMFDPDKVERLMPACGVDSTMRVVPHMVDIVDGWYVRYDEYAELLSLYGTVCELLRISQSYVDNPPKP